MQELTLKDCARSRSTQRRCSMFDRKIKLTYQSVLGPMIEQFIQEKNNLGCKCKNNAYYLRDLDRFLSLEGWGEKKLPKELACRWAAKRSHEGASTHHTRINVLRR